MRENKISLPRYSYSAWQEMIRTVLRKEMGFVMVNVLLKG